MTTPAFNFDKIIDRRGTHTVKIDGLQENFGRTDLMPLWIADMDFEVCPAVTQALEHRLEECHIYGYTMPTEGYWQSIINWQHRRNSFDFTREEVTYIPGIVTGFGLALQVFTQPGQQVVIQEPVYHPFKRLIEGNGRKVINNALLLQDSGYYHMDLEGLEHIFATQHPAMMVLCNPHNPVGITWPADVLRQVAQLASRYGVVVFDDEIHSDLVMPGNHHTVFATVSPEAQQVALTFGAPTKTFNTAGLQSSWCVIKNPELRERFFSFLEVNELSSPTFPATIATQAAYEQGEPWLEQCIAYVAKNIEFVSQFCHDRLPGIRAIKPQAGYLVWLDCTGLHCCHERVVSLFEDGAHLALNEGTMFGQAGACHMRLNCATPRTVLEQAMSRLEQALHQLQEK